MAARFRQVSDFDGVDEGAGPLDAAIIVPLGGSNLVFLEGGAGLEVKSDSPSTVASAEIKDISGDVFSLVANLGLNIAALKAMLSSGAKRLFRVSGNGLVGGKGVAVNAKSPKSGTVQAKLQAIVLKPKPMKVALQQIQVFTDETHKFVSPLTQGKFDPQAMLDHMNWVWGSQACITWSLGMTNPVLIDAIDIRSDGPNRDDKAQDAALRAKLDRDANLTIFFSRKAFDPNGVATNTPWNFGVRGYTVAQGAYCVVADDRGDFTLEHEQGHFLGALDEKGKFVAIFPHSAGHDIMNIKIASNGTVPAKLATVFNKGFVAKP
jgi:hypothetical protein